MNIQSRTWMSLGVIISYLFLAVLVWITRSTNEPDNLPVERVDAPLVSPTSETSLSLQPAEQVTRSLRAHMSHYTPWTGGTNCSNFVNGQCISRMASGQKWQDWVGRATACPKEFPFWTVFTLPGGEKFVCLDRGGRIVTLQDGSIWLDLLVEQAPVPYNTVIDVVVTYP